MKAKHTKLKSDYHFDFDLLGLVAPMREYKVGWLLNTMDEFDLSKEDDIKIELANDFILRISNLREETDFRKVYLLKNRLDTGFSFNQYLLPELKEFDFLLKVKHEVRDNWVDDLLLKMKDIELLRFVTKIELEKIKNKENLLF
ncbi:MAG: IPExxxVDY family protein [Cyclobacteriaceae bacterium]